MIQSIVNQRRQILETRVSQLLEEYEAINKQITHTLSDKDVLRLQRQAKHTEIEIDKLERKLFQLDQETSSESDIELVVAYNQTTKITKLLNQHFDREELRTLCFQLGIDYDDLPAEGRANKARELVKLLSRQDRLPALVALCKELRPNADWEKHNVE